MFPHESVAIAYDNAEFANRPHEPARKCFAASPPQSSHPWDVDVIGGGVIGVGVAIDAASRGYDVLLPELKRLRQAGNLQPQH